MLLDGALTVGVFQAFFQYVNQASEPLTEAAYMVNSMQSALASLERVYDLLDEEEISADPALPATVNNAKGAVEFCNVRFGYTPERILMRDISFSVKMCIRDRCRERWMIVGMQHRMHPCRHNGQKRQRIPLKR